MSPHRVVVHVLFAAAAIVVASRAVAQGRPAPADTSTPQVMVVGAYHMDNPGMDQFNRQAEDVRSPRRQRELEDLVERLAAWRPTKVVLEYTPAADSAFNARYQAYLSGAHELSRDEREQVGFRLARRMGHARVFGADWKKDMDIDRVLAAAPGSGRAAQLQRAFGRVQAAMAEWQRLQPSRSITDIFIADNGPAADRMHGDYLVLAAVNSDTGYVGADVVAGWYERNLKIFANVARVASPGDRVIVFFGSSHRPPLRDYFAASPDFRCVEPLPFLTRPLPTRK